MKQQLSFLAASAILVLVIGCSTTPAGVGHPSRKARTAFKAKTTDSDVASLAEYYLQSGAAKDMAEAIQMAKDHYWSEVEDERSLLGKQEKELEEIRKQAEANKRK